MVGMNSRIMSAKSCTSGMTEVPSFRTMALNDCETSDRVSPSSTPDLTALSSMTRPSSWLRSIRPSKDSWDCSIRGLMLYATDSPNSSAAFAALSSAVCMLMISFMAPFRSRSVPSSFFAAFSNVDISTPDWPAA